MGDHCAIFGYSNDRRYPEKQVVKPHVDVLRFYSPLNLKDAAKWKKLINRRDFKVKLSTKVCSNHVKTGYRSKDCPNPTFYSKGYDCSTKSKRRAYPKVRLPIPLKAKRRRLVDNKQQAPDQVKAPNENSYIKKEPTETVSGIDNMEGISESVSQCEDVRTKELPEMCETTQRRNLFLAQATCTKNCFRDTGITRPKLDLVWERLKACSTGRVLLIPHHPSMKKEGTTQDSNYLGGTYIDPFEDKERLLSCGYLYHHRWPCLPCLQHFG